MINKTRGRQVIRTAYKLSGNLKDDLIAIPKILREAISVHTKNVEEIDPLMDIFFNDYDIDKTKLNRPDINNQINLSDAFSATRTINGYCFGEPIKLVCLKSADEKVSKELQEFYEILLSESNHDATMTATLYSSICGVGYKLCLPKKPVDDGDAPFKITGDIDPRNAFVVRNNDVISEAIMGVIITKYKDNNNHKKKRYNVYTRTHFCIFEEGNTVNEYKLKQVDVDGKKVDAYPIFTKRVPLIEYPRNAFRLGDWEIHFPILQAKSKLLSNRLDDIEQVVDYILLLINCKFDDKDDAKETLSSRLLEVMQTNESVKPDAKILQNQLNQSEIQLLQDFLDLKWQEAVGLPNRQERGGGGGDTGQAVIYRNGFTDLENNAGLILPKAEKAEKELIRVALSYIKNKKEYNIANILAKDIGLAFVRLKTDNPYMSSQAYRNFVDAGMPHKDALIASNAVVDPTETAKTIETSKEFIEKEALKIAERLKKLIELQKIEQQRQGNSQGDDLE